MRQLINAILYISRSGLARQVAPARRLPVLANSLWLGSLLMRSGLWRRIRDPLRAQSGARPDGTNTRRRRAWIARARRPPLAGMKGPRCWQNDSVAQAPAPPGRSAVYSRIGNSLHLRLQWDQQSTSPLEDEISGKPQFLWTMSSLEQEPTHRPLSLRRQFAGLISTRRLAARPAAVLLSATGLDSP